MLLDNGREKFPIFLPQGLLLLGFGILLALNWPGQMSYDFVVQLADGRSGHYDSWHPPVMAWLLGLFDSILPGPGLFLLFTALLLLGAWLLLLRRGRPGLGRRDIPYTDLRHAAASSLSGHDLEGRAVRQCGRSPRLRFWPRPPPAGGRHAGVLFWLVLSAMLLSLAMLARQNGFLLLPIAAICLGVIAAKQRPVRAGWRYGASLLIGRVWC